ncbi:MAG: hypothetical protein Q8Q92_00430 [bacterium]|nr:hypothetical protein [bacterium]
MPEDKKVFFTDSDKRTTERITFLLAGLILLAAIIAALLSYLENFQLSILGILLAWLLDFLRRVWPFWKFLAAILSLLAIAGIIHNSRKLKAINLEEQKIYGIAPEIIGSGEEKIIEPKNEKWEKVLKYANSDNASDWRLAIIEADVMLEEFLRTAGYHGESVGEMLKSVDKNEFSTLDDAWEAHKMRNAVAHSGQDFQLNEHETKRIIALFGKVFREFGVI